MDHAGDIAPRVQLIYFDAGGGHRSAAAALRAVLRERGVDASLVNLQELLDPLDVLRQWFRIRLQDYYNLLVANEWTWGLRWAARALQLTIRLRRPALEAALREHFVRTRPALVVSLIPHFNPLLARALRRAMPEARFLLVITDLADAERPSFWLQGIEPGAQGWPHRVACGSARAVDQARAAGLPPQRILAASGMILRPAFYHSTPGLSRDEARRRLRLEPGVPTAMVLAGAAGGHSMIGIARRLERVTVPVQSIFLCGRNPALAAVIRQLPARYPRCVLEFREDVPDLMRAADFFIGKPGPGSLSEALQMGLPAIVTVNRRTLPQERYNAHWLEENGWGMALRRWSALEPAVERLLAPGVLHSYRARIPHNHNRAVFEIAAACQEELARAAAGQPEVS